MIFKYSLLTVTIIGFVLIGCENIVPKSAGADLTGKDVLATLDSLSRRLSLSIPSEEVAQVNEDMRRTVESIRSSKLLMEINGIYKKNKHDFALTLSDDKKLGVFSWHTQMDATGNKIKNIALYKNGDKLEPSSLYDTPITYNKIYQVESQKGEHLYILHGYVKSGDSHYSRLNAYILKNGYLEEVPAFPNNESSISIAQILKNPDFSDSLGFKVEMNGTRILFPEIRDTSITEQFLAFNGKKYIREQRRD